MPNNRRAGLGRALTLVMLAGLASCRSALEPSDEAQLRHSIADAVARETALTTVRTTAPLESTVGAVDRLELSPPILQELESMAGPASYPPADGAGGKSLALDQALKLAAEHNLRIKQSRQTPAIATQERIAADAFFDWSVFSTLTWQNTDEPLQVPVIGGQAVGASGTQFQDVDGTVGVRKQLESGGTITLQHELGYNDDASPGIGYQPNPSARVNLAVLVSQPLLRGYGSEVSRAEYELAQNTERKAMLSLEQQLMDTLARTERAYWDLVRAAGEVRIDERLLARGVEVRDQLKGRLNLDATPAALADASARVERRRADLLRARTHLRDTSDALKVLVNDPASPVADEALVNPAVDLNPPAWGRDLLDAVKSAAAKRPEVRTAAVSIEDASVRMRIAKSNAMPRLDVQARLAANELQDDVASAYDARANKYVDYMLGLIFETPIGNRGPTALEKARRLERTQTLIAYKDAVQQAVLIAKNALRAAELNFTLIEQTKAGRVAAAESLRTLLVEKTTFRGITVERLDLELNRQEALATAERDELAAITDYRSALASLDAAMGVTLEKWGVAVKGETVEDAGVDEAPASKDAGPKEPASKEAPAPERVTLPLPVNSEPSPSLPPANKTAPAK